MKKLIACFLLTTLFMLTLVSCNYDIIDTQFSYDTAIITLHDGERIEISVKSWRDYEDGEQLQITSTDDKVYLVSSYNCILIDE